MRITYSNYRERVIQANDYAYINNGGVKGIVYCEPDGAIYFLSDSPNFDGNAMPGRNRTGFDYSWVFHVRQNYGYTFDELMNRQHEFDYEHQRKEWDCWHFCGDSVPDMFLSFLREQSGESLFTSHVDTDVPNAGGVSEFPSEYRLEDYSTDTMYVGYHGYHHHHGCAMNTPVKDNYKYRIGVELEVEFQSASGRDQFCDVPSNWFYRESDSSLDGYGVEIITIPLLSKDASSKDVWESLTKTIYRKASSWDTGRCGCHVHIGRGIFGDGVEERNEGLSKLIYFYHHYLKDTPLNRRIYGRDRGYHDCDCKTEEGNAVSLLGSSVLKDKKVAKKVADASLRKSEESRYFDVNLLTHLDTVEFRKGKGSLNPRRIAAIVEWSELICLYVKRTSWQRLGMESFDKFLKARKINSDMIREFMED